MSTRTLNLTDQLYNYILDRSLREQPEQKALREETAKLEWANMQISPEQGQFMQLMAKLINAKKVIEIGTFTGYSSLAVALALPDDGQLIACDISEEWTAIARRYWQRAGVEHKIDLRIAPAQQTLNGLLDEAKANNFDMVFIDADKTGYDAYYEASLKLLRSGGLLLIDNTLWSGTVADDSIDDSDTVALRELNIKIHRDERVEMSLLPISDGLTLVMKK